MLCDICHKNEATIHIQEIVGNQKKTMHLCNECAASKQAENGLNFGPFNLAEVLYKLAGKNASDNKTPSASGPGLVCPQCGWDEKKLRSSGQLGCAECYKVFSSLLAEALKSMHRGTSHLGKHPAGNSDALELRQCRDRLNMLQKELQSAIASEEYEKAAVLRDRIGELKQKCGKIGHRDRNGAPDHE